jgi:hydrogenase nickel incorporation protein HypB
MCRDCGCSDPERLAQLSHAHAHAHAAGEVHPNVHAHQHAPPHAHSHDEDHAKRAERTMAIQRAVTELNDHLAQHNRETFSDAGVFALNLMSSPGAGKTRLLESTLRDLANLWRMAVVVGDLATENDAERLRCYGAPIVPIATGTMCHLEADMVGQACRELDLRTLDVLFIENVGNLVCPASFDLGEALRVVLMSIPEGEDKPLKYPPMFKLADVVVLTKTDLIEAAGFDRDRAVDNIRHVAPQAEIIELSVRTGEGLQRWYGLLEQRILALTKDRTALGLS